MTAIPELKYYGIDADNGERFTVTSGEIDVLYATNRLHQQELERILAITNTPEWFGTPCARAIRESLTAR